MGKGKRRSNAHDGTGPTPSQESLVVTSAQDAAAKAVKVAADSSAATVEQGEDADLEMGDFEDQWMDEEEGEDDDGDVIVDPGSDAEEAGDDAPLADDMQLDSDKATRSKAADNGDDGDDEAVNVYLPGQKLEEGEVLVPDNSVYEMLHQLHVEWPCLSFDFLKDNLGINRKTFPMTCYLVAGSQAEKAKDNKLYVMKMSDLYRTKHDTDDDMDEDSGDEDLDEDPVLEHRTIPHNGGVNRVRVMPHPDAHHVVSSWSENGRVYIWDVTQVVASLDVPGTTIPKEAARPIYTVEAHNKHEGFAMDWTGLNQKYRLLTGDVAGLIYQTSSTPSSFTTEQQAFRGHTGSVEDIQWSPSEDTVFASCSSDKTVRIWDTRTKKKSQIAFTAHDSDVNVISWNRLTDNLLASGSDSGSFSIWDLRSVAQSSSGASSASPSTATPAATFAWHRAPVTSIEWHPYESSMLAVAGADDQVTIWDLALERDPEEEAIVVRGGGDAQAPVEVPPQLLFVHQGQQDVKEIRWHRQLPGVLAATALSGFSVFKTINT